MVESGWPGTYSMAMIGTPGRVVHRVDRADVGMVERGGRARLGQRGAGRDRAVRLEDLERHGPVELEVARQVDPGERARADLRLDQVVREEMPGPQASRTGRCATGRASSPRGKVRPTGGR